MKSLVQTLIVLGVIFFILKEKKTEVQKISNSISVSTPEPYKDLKKTIYEVRGLGDVDENTLHSVAQTIQDFYGFTTIVKNNVNITSEMYIPNTDHILNGSVCLEQLNDKTKNTIYVTDKELWSTGDYINGLGHLNGNSVIITTTSNKIDEVVKHEVGHNLGLGHCDEITCVMASRNDQYETGKFCNKCKNYFKKTFNINE